MTSLVFSRRRILNLANFILSAFADEIDMDLDLQMSVIKQHGINHIEMRGVNGKCVVDYSLEEISNIKEQLDANGVKISSIGSPIGKIKITDEFDEHLELFKHTVEITKMLGAKYIRMFSFFIPEGDNPDDYRDEVVRRWKCFLEVVKGTDIILLHENEKDIYGDIPERCMELVKQLDNSSFKLIFDPANYVQCGINTYPDAYDIVKDEVVYFHIKDAIMESGKVVPAGYGDGKIKEILSDLITRNYDGFLSLEPHLGNFAGFAELENGQVEEELEDSGPEKFAIAVNALKDILNAIS